MTLPEQLTAIWSFRWTVGRGWQWRHERYCTKNEALQWLAVFQRDEPRVTFKIARNKPRT